MYESKKGDVTNCKQKHVVVRATIYRQTRSDYSHQFELPVEL
jgi:hypothetical protein